MICFLLDWDDTLFPQSYYYHTTERQFRVLETILAQLLKDIAQFGQVHVVTNAKEKWISHCRQLFENHALFENVLFHYNESGCPYFKLKKFKELSGACDEVITVGDSLFEVFAAKNLKSSHRVKIIKLKERPRFNELISQIVFFIYLLPSIVKYRTHLYICQS